MHSEYAKRLAADGLVAAHHIPAIEAVLNAVGQEEAKLNAAKDAAGALWFRLDEIDAVARSIELVEEHVEDGQDKTGRIFALARTLSELVGSAKECHGNIEAALNAATAKRA